jgi:hypothetical protein
MTNLEKLNGQRDLVVTNLRGGKGSSELKDTVKTLKAIDVKIEIEKRSILLNGANSNQQKLRDSAKVAWECEVPEIDVTCNNLSFHAIKVKKYPKLAASGFRVKKLVGNLILELQDGQTTFYMYDTKHEYDRPTVYTRPQTFTDFLILNRIRLGDLSLIEYKKILKKVEQSATKLKKSLLEYDKSAEGFHRLNEIDLLGQRGNTYYIYTKP